MKTALAQYLRDHGADDETINHALALAEPMELPTRHILLNQGEQPAHAFFLVDGICHACYLTPEGRQFSKEFYWEQELILGFEKPNYPAGFRILAGNPVRQPNTRFALGCDR